MLDKIDGLEPFRSEARAWLADNVPASLRGTANIPGEMIPGASQLTPDQDLWRRRMGEKGWGAPTWPKAYGGGGLSPAEARVLGEEMAAIGVLNPIVGMGTSMFGPTLLEYGTEEQKQRHIPSIVRGDLRWCQGYSEPSAGSDLAALQTKLEDAGDHWVVNGQKIWTSGAQWADWCFCLVRTDTSKKHEGISFVLIDMRQPGVETRPIKLIAGNSPFCETFFTNARVEKNDMVGPWNGGWTIGKRLLQHERSGQGGGRMMGGGRLSDVFEAYWNEADGEEDVRSRMVGNLIDAKAHALMPHSATCPQRCEGQSQSQRHHVDHEELRHPDRPGEGGTDVGNDGRAGPGLGGRRVRRRRENGCPDLAVRKGHHDLRRLVRDPEQHHFKTHFGPARLHEVGIGGETVEWLISAATISRASGRKRGTGWLPTSPPRSRAKAG